MNPWASLIEPARPPILGDGIQVSFRSRSAMSERGACVVKLLRHGPLCWNELVSMTGWSHAVVSRVLLELKQAHMVYRADGEWRLEA